MPSLDFLRPLYKGPHGREALICEMDAVLGGQKSVARALPFYCHVPAADWVKGSVIFRRYVSKVWSGDGVHLFEGGPPIEQDGGFPRFFLYEHPEYPGVYALLTLESAQFFKWLQWAVEKSFPSTMTTFITHRTLRHLLESFQSGHGLTRLVIKRASLRIRYGEHTKKERARIVPIVSWPDWELQEAFDWVYQQNGWFQSLKFDAYRNHSVPATISFTRQGITQTNGLFQAVFSGFVEPVCKRIHENVNLFGQRARRERSDLSVRPLAIRFDGDQIAQDDERRRFVNAMKRLSRASVSVLHGNPYVHLSVLDYYDGSAFDVWVLSGNEITIVPQMKGTITATKRLINHIFDDYAEGRIADYGGEQA